MNLKTIIAIILFLAVTNRSDALGFGRWNNETPGGNHILHDHWSGITSFYMFKDEQRIDSLDKWYFFKNFVIGEFSNSSKYFIVNEATSQIIIFQNKEGWSYGIIF